VDDILKIWGARPLGPPSYVYVLEPLFTRFKSLEIAALRVTRLIQLFSLFILTRDEVFVA